MLTPCVYIYDGFYFAVVCGLTTSMTFQNWTNTGGVCEGCVQVLCAVCADGFRTWTFGSL